MKVVNKKQSIFNRLSQNASIALRNASFVSEHLKEDGISVISILIGILLNEDCIATRVIEEMKVDRGDILETFLKGKLFEVTAKNTDTKLLEFSSESQELLREAFLFAQNASHVYVGTEHLMLAILKSGNRKVKSLSKLGLTRQSFSRNLYKVAHYPMGALVKPSYGDDEDDETLMDRVGYDLVDFARRGKLDPVIGREEEISQIVNILSRRNKNNPIVIGEPGVGKSVLIEGLAQKIASGDVPPSLKGYRIIHLDISTITAGSRMRGDVEHKLISIVNEIIRSKNTILFIDEIHNIVSSAMPGGASEIASVLKPALLRNDFRCIGTTTTEEYTMYFESDAALNRRFQPLFLKEASTKDSIEILGNIKPLLEKHHKVRISEEALKSAVLLSDRYVADRYLPDKAIDLLDEASASKRFDIESSFGDLSDIVDQINDVKEQIDKEIIKGNMEEAIKLRKKEASLSKKLEKREKECLKSKRSIVNEVSGEDVRTIVSKWTGIPLNTIGGKERAALLKLEDILKKRVIGQEEACRSVASAIKRARTGIIDEGRPWASFLFLGPTGVGKTELSKVLTTELFGDENRLVQIDMSEMMEMHSVSKLIGSPPGYIGYQQGGWLTEKVRREPHSVILFDEVEKAHPDVLNVLLQILEYGHLTDGRGRRVNFKNTVIILTSNIGAEEIAKDRVLGFVEKGDVEKSDKEIDDAYSSMKSTLLEELKSSLRPELLNRIDDIVIFRTLNRKDARKIVKLLVSDLNRRLEEENIKVVLDSKAVTYIVKNSFSEEYGARPIRRFLQEKVENILADFMLENRNILESGDDISLKITVEDDNLTII